MSRTNGSHVSGWFLGLRSALLAALVSILGAAGSRAATVSGTISAPGGGGLADAEVMFFDPATFDIFTTTTDANGEYSLDVPAGCWRMQVSSLDYGIINYPGTVFEEDTLGVVVSSSGSVIDLHLPAGHSIGGVFTASGPLPSAIEVLLVGEFGEETTVFAFFSSGSWSIPYVPEGKYRALARDGDFPPNYAPQWFGGANNSSLATLINLTADRDDVDFDFPPAVTVGGHVTRPGGGSGAGDRVLLVTRDGEDFLQTTTNASGNFSFSNPTLVPGYQFQLLTLGTLANPFFTSLPNLYMTFPASAGDWKIATPGANSGFEITGQAPGSVAGHVLEAGTNNAIAGATVFTFDPIQTFRLAGGLFSSTPSDANGAYTIPGIQPFNRYGLLARPQSSPSNYHVTGTFDMFDVSPGAITGKDIHLEIGGKFGGTITRQSDGSPVTDAVLQFLFTDCTLVPTFSFTSGTGEYLSEPLLAGSYKVQVIPSLGSDLATKFGGGADTCAAASLFALTPGATTTVDVALPAISASGHTVSGTLDDAGNGHPIAGTVELFTNGRFYLAHSDACGQYSIPAVASGTYDAVVFAHGYAGQNLPGAVVVGGSDVVKDFHLNAANGAISGRVTYLTKPVQGATVCTESGLCAVTDSDGYYRIFGLSTGTYKIVCYARDNLEPSFFQNKSSLATADGISVVNGSETTGKDFNLGPVPADPLEADDIGTPSVLSRPETGSEPALLRPDAPQTRSFSNTEDSDWFRFTATAGKVYRLTITGGAFDLYAPFVGVFDGATKASDAAAATAIVTASGWTAPSSGERWIGLSSSFSGTYTATLTESSPGPPPPTISSINPTSGPAAGGTTVTITGTNFVAGTTVKFGTGNATNVVIGGGGTTITCKSPALPAGTLNDVVVTTPGSAVVVGGAAPHAPDAVATLAKGWFVDFGDVSPAFLYHNAIEKIVRAGITTGCGGGNYCPNDAITRDAMAVFILKGKHGGSYNPPTATGTVFQDVQTTTFLAKWMEQFGNEGISSGCGTSPGAPHPNYCPTGLVTRDGMAVFLEKGKNGSSFNPPAATGTAFCDVLTTTFLGKWAEQLKADNITQGCGSGNCPRLGGTQPNYCPTGTVTRGEMAPFIVRTFGL